MIKFFRMLRTTVKVSRLQAPTFLLIVLYLSCAAIIALAEPSFGGFGNSLWYLFEAMTTIGFGDFAATTLVGRAATVVLSLYSLFYLAFLTGAFVSFATELLKRSADESTLEFLDRMEHLDELSQDELRELSARVKKFRDQHE